MSKIVAVDGYSIGTNKHLVLLYNLAKKRAYDNRDGYFPEGYRWRLGIQVLSDLQKDYYFLRNSDPTVKPMLFDIPVDIDYENPENVQLWEDITNKL